ncbi:MAG: hypothetical protein V2A66_02040 [Pseudomonadota bacterium]
MEKVTGRVMRSEAEWKAIFEAQRISNRSAAGFCREHGIDYGHFLYHRRKILTDDGLALAVLRSGGVVPAVRDRGFIPIRVEDPCGMRLRFPRGLILEADRIPPAAWVAELAARWVGAEAAPC